MTSRVNLLQPVYLRTVLGEVFLVLYTYQAVLNAFISSLIYMCLQRDMILLYVSSLVVDWKSGYKERPLGLNTSCGFHFACILNILRGAVHSRISEFEGSTTGGGVYVLDKE